MNKNYIISLFLILLIILLSYNYINYRYWKQHNIKLSEFQKETKIYNYKDYNKIPKIIWTYWHSEKIPNLIKKCIDTWKKHNPHYIIIVLNKNNYKNYINIPDDIANHSIYNDSHARFTDLIRLFLLYENGGVWIDSSIILKESLDKWLFNKEAEFSGFYLESYGNKYPVIESWFLASNKNSDFMRLWRNEFLQILNYGSVSEYNKSRKEMGVDFQKIGSSADYLVIHISCQKVIQIDKYPLNNLVLRKAEDGPFKYLNDAKWDQIKAMYNASNKKDYTYPIMKMTKGDRDILSSINSYIFFIKNIKNISLILNINKDSLFL